MCPPSISPPPLPVSYIHTILLPRAHARVPPTNAIKPIEITQINAPDYVGKLDPMQYYMRKNYYKTASLIANSCLASTLLGGGSVQAQEAAFEYGLGCGLSFQLVDDLLDFRSSAEVMGKPILNDLKR